MKPDFAVIFDMDGVLVDSMKYIETSFDHVLSPHKITIAEIRANHDLSGISLRNFAKLLKEHHGITLRDENEISHEASDIMLRIMAEDGTRADPDLIQLLEALRAESIPCGVGSSSHTYHVERMLRHLKIERYFQAALGSEELERHKPHPDIFLEVAKKLDMSPSRCVVIEDAPKGVEAARAAGMKAIGYDAFTDDNITLENADLVISSFSQLTSEKIENLIKGVDSRRA